MMGNIPFLLLISWPCWLGCEERMDIDKTKIEASHTHMIRQRRRGWCPFYGDSHICQRRKHDLVTNAKTPPILFTIHVPTPPRVSSLSLSPNLTSKKRILIPQILAAIRLPKAHHPRRVQPPRLGRAPRRDAKPERDIRHAVHHAPLMLRAILAPPPDVGLDDV